MPGPAHYSENADASASARAQLDAAVEIIGGFEVAQRRAVAALVDMWPTAAWLAAGCTSAKKFLLAYTPMSELDAHRLVGIAELCARHARLAAAVDDGTVSVARAGRLARAVTPERARCFTDDVCDAFIGLAARGCRDDEFGDAVRFFVDRADEVVEPRRVPAHGVQFAERLFGGGDVHASLAPAAFARVTTAIDAFCQDPEPKDAPYRRSLAERRADGLDDLAAFGLLHEDDGDGGYQDLGGLADDTFDGIAHPDKLDAALAHPDADALDRLRAGMRLAEQRRHRRAARQVKARSGVTLNVHVDLSTLLGIRDIDELDDLVLHGDGWGMTRSAVEELLCDSGLVATLFAGRTHILDANPHAEQFSRAQRRAIAGRDRGCVFPACNRSPRHCDAHHLHPRHKGGPTVTSNAACLCRFHHRLVHHYGWSITVDADGCWTATDAHGTEWKGRPSHQTAA